MSEAAIFRARAEQELANAATATLANVRDRAERSAKAWGDMAERAERTVALRESREAARVAAE